MFEVIPLTPVGPRVRRGRWRLLPRKPWRTSTLRPGRVFRMKGTNPPLDGLDSVVIISEAHEPGDRSYHVDDLAAGVLGKHDRHKLGLPGVCLGVAERCIVEEPDRVPVCNLGLKRGEAANVREQALGLYETHSGRVWIG